MTKQRPTKESKLKNTLMYASQKHEPHQRQTAHFQEERGGSDNLQKVLISLFWKTREHFQLTPRKNNHGSQKTLRIIISACVNEDVLVLY